MHSSEQPAGLRTASTWLREKKMQKEQEFRQRLVESFPDVIVALDTAGNYTYASVRVKEVLGYPPEFFVGRPFGEVIAPDDMPGSIYPLIASGEFEGSLIHTPNVYDFPVSLHIVRQLGGDDVPALGALANRSHQDLAGLEIVKAYGWGRYPGWTWMLRQLHTFGETRFGRPLMPRPLGRLYDRAWDRWENSAAAGWTHMCVGILGRKA